MGNERMSEDRGHSDALCSLPYFVTTDDVADLLRFEPSRESKHGETGNRENRLKQARGWLIRHGVPFVRAGKRRVYRREAVMAALADAEEAPVSL